MERALIIGATGNVGREVVSQLTARETQVRAMTRDPSVARFPSHVEVVRGDLGSPETLDECVDGVDAVFLVWTAPLAAVAPALERIGKRAPRIVLLSSPHKTPHPFFQQPNPMRLLHAEIERVIEISGCDWTFVRPGIFAGNSVAWWAEQIRTGDLVRWPHLAVHTAPTDVHDIAAVAVHALCESGQSKKEYVVTGPESLSQFEQISIIGKVLGRSLRIEEMTADEARRELPMPLPVANMLLDAWAAAAGLPAFVTSTIAEVTGMPARTFVDWATDHADEFRA
jgi:uncharacterized protein YbjT (DUF2867 family)